MNDYRMKIRFKTKTPIDQEDAAEFWEWGHGISRTGGLTYEWVVSFRTSSVFQALGWANEKIQEILRWESGMEILGVTIQQEEEP